MQDFPYTPAPQGELAKRPSKRTVCNQDPAWHQFIERLNPVIKAIAVKACAADEALREDCIQEAMFELAKHYPEDCTSYRDYLYGLCDRERCEQQLLRFSRQVVRNTIYSVLDAYPTGNWYIGRTRSVTDKRTGAVRKVRLPARFSSLDELVDDYGMQVDEFGCISWPEPSVDGLVVGSPNSKSPSRVRWYDYTAPETPDA
jgi:hypothetical protein